MKTAATLLVATLILLGLQRPADACSCLRPEGPTEELAKASAVFEGRVASLERGATVRVTLEVQRAWKGLDVPTIVVTTAPNSAACGFHFAEGERYLIYASEVEGELAVSLCSRSREIAGAGEDLEALGAASYEPGAFPAPSEPAPSEPAPSEPGEPAPAGTVEPIAPPPPPPAAKSGGCAGCSAAAPSSEPGLWALCLLALPLLRRRVVS